MRFHFDRGRRARHNPTALRPLRALRALVRVARDPEQTEVGAMMVASLSGRSWERHFERFGAHPTGARILAEGRRLDLTLLDRERLAAMPDGSLGRVYFEWTRNEGIDASGLLSLPREVMPVSELTPEFERFALRERVTHDLWHVVTGYGRDLLGEAALLQIMWIQTQNTGLLLPTMLSRLSHLRSPEGRKVLREARRRAHGSSWLPAETGRRCWKSRSRRSARRSVLALLLAMSRFSPPLECHRG